MAWRVGVRFPPGEVVAGKSMLGRLGSCFGIEAGGLGGVGNMGVKPAGSEPVWQVVIGTEAERMPLVGGYKKRLRGVGSLGVVGKQFADCANISYVLSKLGHAV